MDKTVEVQFIEIIRPAKGRRKDTERENMAVKVFELELIATVLRREFWLW